MYFDLARRVIEKTIELHAVNFRMTSDEILAEIDAHVEATSFEHWKDEPQIQYGDPLCRLGYLYMHAAANATLFERVILKSDSVRLRLSNASRSVLNVCSMGGGPGTELLGLTKYFLSQPDLIPPRKISFTVIDNVSEWADTWTQLAEATEEELRSAYIQSGVELPTVAPMFLPYDVFDSSSYRDHVVQFNKFDMVVFNYLFSENKAKLSQAREAISELARVIGDECVFVVIDRREHNVSFTNEVVSIFEFAFGVDIDFCELTGRLDSDEQTSDLGPMLTNAVERRPRLKFWTDGNRAPTVFWFVVERK